MFATNMRTGQAKIMAQEVAQQSARLDSMFVVAPVDGYFNTE
jgi:hypothetical protein